MYKSLEPFRETNSKAVKSFQIQKKYGSFCLVRINEIGLFEYLNGKHWDKIYNFVKKRIS